MRRHSQSGSNLETALDQTNLHVLVSAEAAGEIAEHERALLEASPDRWVTMLHELLDETEESLDRVARSDREERDQVLADLSEERDRLIQALRRVSGEDVEIWDDDAPDDNGRDHDGPSDPPSNGHAPRRGAPAKQTAEPVLQASWMDGLVVVWGGGPAARPADADDLHRLIGDAGGAGVDWSPHKPVPLPSGQKASALAAPIDAALGWLVGIGSRQLGTDAGPSILWLGDITVWATEMAAQGRMVPKLAPTPGRRNQQGTTAEYAVRWTPAIVDGRRLRQHAARMPGAVGALSSTRPERTCRSVLDAAVDAICRAGAARLVSPATAPLAKSRRDVDEAVIAGLDGTPFTASRQPAGYVAHELGLWAAPISSRRSIGLAVELHTPERDGGWLLTLLATGIERHPVPLQEVLDTASGKKTKLLEAEQRRLERLLPVLRRARDRKTEVILGGDEAWELMRETGPILVAAGFDVRVPAMSPRRPTPRLQLRADPPPGVERMRANELAQVRWSVLFDDVELDAADIARLAREARPLVKAKGQWVELDRADLDAAAEALAQRNATGEMSGAAIVRHAVGLEDNPLGGPVALAGSGWAVDLVHNALDEPPAPLPAPEDFSGELRSYQGEARGWLSFLDRAGLGGCLAMDMGLGKTPTVLAHLLATREDGPALVVAPAAVLGNWAAEAARFAPDLDVRVHHGGSRAGADEVAGMAKANDLVLTTYATAVRDVEALADVDWQRVVLDEAQAIKNPASDTAQQLRRIPARFRLALTGTPIENSLSDLWSILDFVNPGLVGERPTFVQQLSKADNGDASGEDALRALNGLLVFRRTKAEPAIAAELPDKIDELDHCGMTSEQIGLYQAILDGLIDDKLAAEDPSARKGHVLAAITALKQVCNHPSAYLDDDEPLAGRSGKLARLEELTDAIFDAGERLIVFTHFARWGERLATHMSERTGLPIDCYHGGLSRSHRDRLIREFQETTGPGALVLSIKAGGAGLNLTAANHVVLYDRWWNPAVEDQARDRAWRIGQTETVVSHRLVCPGTIDDRVEEVVAGKRRIADLVLPASSSLGDLGAEQLRTALGLRPEAVLDADELTGNGNGTNSSESTGGKGRAA